MEKLMQYTWKYKLFPAIPITSNKGQCIEIIDPGIHNNDSGPDFFNAKIKIDGTIWVGNVEIHSQSGDWFKHGHQKDKRYNNVILHVVEKADCEIVTEDGKTPPQIEINVPEHIRRNYNVLKMTDDYPRCHNIIRKLDILTIHSWMNSLLCERLEQKSERIIEHVKRLNGDWEKAYFITLARNFGFGINGETFELWAQRIPMQAIMKHRDNLFQIEAIFMGQAGLLEYESIPERHRSTTMNDEYFNNIKKEYSFLAHKFSLSPMDASQWKFLRLRPQNFPHVRISQLAQMYFDQKAGFSDIIEKENIEELYKCLSTHATNYWQSHYAFGYKTSINSKTLTKKTLDLIIINTVVPLMHAYGMSHANDDLCNKATNLLSHIEKENNSITRIWEKCGIYAESASDSQALIQLKKEYCDRRYCLRCRFGYEFMKCKDNE